MQRLTLQTNELIMGSGTGHQTGWTGLVAVADKLFGSAAPKRFLQAGPTFRKIIKNR